MFKFICSGCRWTCTQHGQLNRHQMSSPNGRRVPTKSSLEYQRNKFTQFVSCNKSDTHTHTHTYIHTHTHAHAHTFKRHDIVNRLSKSLSHPLSPIHIQLRLTNKVRQSPVHCPGSMELKVRGHQHYGSTSESIM